MLNMWACQINILLDFLGCHEGLYCSSERAEAWRSGWNVLMFKVSVSFNSDQILDVNGESFQHVMTLERAVEILTKQTLLQVNNQTRQTLLQAHINVSKENTC